MPILYSRRACVRIAGLEIDESLRLNFEVERTVTRTQARGHIRLYNLRPEYAQRIIERGPSVSLEAGYPDTLALIYEGATQRARGRREGLAYIVGMDIGDEVRKASTLGGVYCASFAGPVAVRTIVADSREMA